jgi:hypothetical protein
MWQIMIPYIVHFQCGHCLMSLGFGQMVTLLYILGTPNMPLGCKAAG